MTHQKVVLGLPGEEGPDHAVGEESPGESRHRLTDPVQQVRGVHRLQVQQLSTKCKIRYRKFRTVLLFWTQQNQRRWETWHEMYSNACFCLTVT